MKKSNILIYGSDSIWAIENYYRKYLYRNMYNVEIFDTSKYYKLNNLFFKIKFHIYDLTIFKSLNLDLLNHCKLFKPDILWVFKGIELYPDTLQKIKSYGIILVNYNTDHPFIRYSPSHGSKNIEHSIPLYDLIFSYRRDLVDIFKTKFSLNSKYLPFGFEKSEFDYTSIDKISELNKVAFIGYIDNQRFDVLFFLAKSGVEIDIYCQDNLLVKILKIWKNIRIFNLVFGEDLIRTIVKYRVQLNLLRKHNIGSHNQRTFEVPAVGGILLTLYSDEQNLFFKKSEEIFFYYDNQSLLNSINDILNMKIEDIHNVRKNAFNRSIQGGYTYQSRTDFIIKCFSEITI
jgi:spore maturation protein CgeB